VSRSKNSSGKEQWKSRKKLKELVELEKKELKKCASFKFGSWFITSKENVSFHRINPI
jgi:hypothetical protein